MLTVLQIYISSHTLNYVLLTYDIFHDKYLYDKHSPMESNLCIKKKTFISF
jgi:hypothetical protein